MKTLTILLAATVLALGLLQLRPAPAAFAQGGSASGGATRVGVVDLQAVLNGSDQFAAMQERQQERARDLQARLQEKQNQVKAGQNQLDALGPGTPAWDAKRREVLEAAAGVQAWEQIAKQLEGSEQAREFLALYEKADAAIAAVAAERGLGVVLAGGQLPDLGALARADRSQITAILQNRKVLYSSAEVDLTQAALLRLNAGG